MRRARSGALQALLITGAGGLAMLGGFVLLGQSAGTYSFSSILADPPTGAAVNVALVLVLVGALTKSAQVPFHSWLPRAMNAPTPVSAFLHSATMVNAGVYLVARLSPAFATAAPWRPIVLCAGAATMLIGGYRSLRQHDLKLVLAYSTISQLGLMMILFGVGTEAATFAGVTLLVAHGVFKAALFMVVGIVDHQTHPRDLRTLRARRDRTARPRSARAGGAAVIARIPTAAWLAIVWVLLWGSPTPANIAGGAAVAVVLTWGVPVARSTGTRFHVISIVRFAVWFAGALVVANLKAAREIVRQRVTLDQSVVEVQLRATSHLVTAFVANSISLTPGTLTVEVAPDPGDGRVAHMLHRARRRTAVPHRAGRSPPARPGDPLGAGPK